MSRSRIYIVRSSDREQAPRLIRAANRAAALRHAARTSMTVGLATQDDIVWALGRQVQIEDDTTTDEQE